MDVFPSRVFFSYAREDEPSRDRLAEQLRPLERAGRLEILHDQLILPGAEWELAIKNQIISAKIILILVSPSYFASEECSKELDLALERHWSCNAIVVPIILRPADWSALAMLQALPRDGAPITTSLFPDQGYMEVAQGIRKLLDSLSQFPPSPSGAMLVSNIHYPRKEYFTDRDDLLAELYKEHATSPQSLTIHALTGMSGIGKSEVVIEYARRYSGAYSVIWWSQASTRQAVRRSLAKLATMLGLNVSPGELPNVITHYDKWLWIFDDVRNYDDIRSFIPPRGPGHIIMTSQSEHWYRVIMHPVEELGGPDSAELLKRIVKSRVDDSGAERLAKLMGGVPLALESVASFALATMSPLSACCGNIPLEERTFTGDFEFRNRQTLVAAWANVLKQIEGKPDAFRTLKICAILEPNDIPRRLLRSLVSNLDNAIVELRRFSLVRAGAETVSMHAFLHEWLLVRLLEAEKCDLVEEVAKVLSREMETADLPTDITPHAMAIASKTCELCLASPAVGIVLATCGMYLRQEGDSDRAAPLLRRAEEVLQPLAEDERRFTYERYRLWARMAEVRGALGNPDGRGKAMLEALRLANVGNQRYDNGYGYFDQVMPRH